MNQYFIWIACGIGGGYRAFKQKPVRDTTKEKWRGDYDAKGQVLLAHMESVGITLPELTWESDTIRRVMNVNFDNGTDKAHKFIVQVLKGGHCVDEKVFNWADQAYRFIKDIREKGFKFQMKKISAINYAKRVGRKRVGWKQPVRIKETGEVFPFVEDCARKVGVSGYCIRESCNKGRAYKGLHFEFVNEKDRKKS